MLERLQHFANTLKTNWSSDPAARGAAKMMAGAVLAAEGLFGVIRGSGKKGSGGLLGGLAGVLFGAVFMAVGHWMAPGYDDQRIVDGRIADVREQRSDGRTMYAGVYVYTVDGKDYEFVSSVTSSSRPTIGEPVRIAYSAREPRNAYRADGLDGNFHRIFFGLGVLVAVLSFFSVLVSLALIGFGVWLFLQGREDRRAAGAAQGFLADLLALAGKARAGEIRIEDTAAGTAGPSQGTAQA
jgi:hypothetical protein